MKKIYSFLTVIAFLLVPFTVFAAVDITLRDTSIEDSKTITIDIDTQTDVLGKVSLPIRFSEGVSISEVTAGDIECSTLEYQQPEDTENEIILNCILDKATALNGTLANISFATTGESYTFELLENERLNIGTLTLGETINIGEVTDAETTELEESTLDTGVPFEDEEFTITQDEPVVETKEGFSIDSITEYLPYILIGGSVILLISIIAILLSKKKDPKDSKPTETLSKRTFPQPPVQETETGGEPSLSSMVNEVNNIQSQPQEAPLTETDMQQDSSFTTTPPTSTTQPPLQQTPPPVPPAQPTPVQPPIQRTSSPEIAPSTQEEDLQEILKRESSRTEAQPTTPQAPVEPQVYTQPEPPTEPSAQGVPFSPDINTPAQTQTPTVEPTDDVSTEYPPVPPSAQAPNTQQQVPPFAETPEELPEVPPTM